MLTFGSLRRPFRHGNRRPIAAWVCKKLLHRAMGILIGVLLIRPTSVPWY